MQIASSRNPPKRLRSNFVLPEYAVGIPRLQAREDVNVLVSSCEDFVTAASCFVANENDDNHPGRDS
jgi:hypothetical protein